MEAETLPVSLGNAIAIPMFLLLSAIVYMVVRLLHLAEEPKPPDLYYQVSPLNNFIIQSCPDLRKVYVPPMLWGRNGKLLSIIYGVFGRVKHVFPKGDRFSVRLQDGATILFDVFEPTAKHPTNVNYTLLVCPGIGNSSESIYIRSFVDTCQNAGYRLAVLNHLGVLPNVKLTAPRIFHYGETKDFAAMVEFVHKRYPTSTFLGVGFSMGANILLKYLAENDDHQKFIKAAISACQGYNAEPSIDYLQNHAGMVVDFLSGVILKRQKRIIRNHAEVLFHPTTLEKHSLPPPDAILNAATIKEYDELYTRRVAGFASLSEFYTSISCCNILNKVHIPVFLLNSLDDPIVPEVMLQYPKNFALSRNNVIYAETTHGGHLGYFEGGLVFPHEDNWMDRVIVHHLNALVEANLHGLLEKEIVAKPELHTNMVSTFDLDQANNANIVNGILA